MNASEHNQVAFYQNLGKLFYAIANTDKSVRDEELNILIDIVKSEWIPSKLVAKNYKERAENSIINTFKWLRDDDEYDAEACYNSFITFKNNHKYLFNNETKALILKTAGAIASSFSGVNKSELIMIAKLDIEFKK